MSVRIPTEAEARAMAQAIEDFRKKDEDAQKAIHDANMATAQSWYDSNGPDVSKATTRDEALANYKTIEGLIRTETDSFRVSICRKKLDEANEKFKEIKRNG